MDEDFEAVAVRVNADTAAFRRELADLRALMARDLGEGAIAAGRGIETALARAARAGKLELEDLARVAAKVLGDIAASAITQTGGGGAAAPVGGLTGLLGGVLGGLFGLPGRAIGGPVAPGRVYVVGERGPELFVPTSAGQVQPAAGSVRGPVTINMHVAIPPGSGPDFMVRTANQLARAVRRSLERQED